MRSWKKLVTSEDWWAVWIGFLVLGAVFLGVVSTVPTIPKWATLGEVPAVVLGVPLLLLMIVVALNLTAIIWRRKLRKRFAGAAV